MYEIIFVEKAREESTQSQVDAFFTIVLKKQRCVAWAGCQAGVSLAHTHPSRSAEKLSPPRQLYDRREADIKS